MSGATTKNTTLELVHYLNEAVLKVGPSRLVTFLKGISSRGQTLEDNPEYRKLASGIGTNTLNDVQDIVIKCSCLKYDVTVHEFMNTRRLQGKLYEVACVITRLLQTHACISQTEIAKKIGRHKTNVHKYHQRVMTNQGVTKDERRMLIYLKEIGESIDKIIANENTNGQEE